jgi:3-oxoadipate enol-lactonase
MPVGDMQIVYDVTDYTEPWREPEPETILLHHGYLRNMEFWRGWVPLLARHYRIVRFNSRGCGGTTVPPAGAPYTVEQLWGDALGLMDRLGVERFHWVSEYSGGIIGLYAALAHPERFLSLATCNTPIKVTAAVAQSYNVGEADHATAIEKLGVGGWGSKTLGFRVDLDKASKPLQDWYVAEMDKVPKHVAIAHHQMVCEGDLWVRLPELRMPILMIVGDQSPLARREERERLLARLPNIRVVHFEGYVHGCSVVAPERCAQEVIAFIQERSQR